MNRSFLYWLGEILEREYAGVASPPLIVHTFFSLLIYLSMFY
jgi:hypothetical protein